MNFLNLLKKCTLCPHKCKVNRLQKEKGYCKALDEVLISSYLAHFGEEPPISGENGSGTIFFGYCNMKCVYCQNFQISQEFSYDDFKKINIQDLSKIMILLQEKGCHNINLVSPTIWIPHIIESIKLAREKNNLKIPIVYNCGGYENPKIIKLLKGFIQIYMPDIRYSDDENAYKFSKIKNYVENNQKSLIEMYNQVGPLKINKKGIAIKGLMIRLLIMPNNVSGVKKSLDFIKNELSTDVYISIMAQYNPLYKAKFYPEINRKISYKEYNEIIKYAEKLGFSNGAIQEFEGLNQQNMEDLFIPDFKSENIFKYKK